MKLEDAIKILIQHIKSHQAIVCLSVKRKDGPFLYPVYDITKFGNYLATEHMYVDANSYYNENYINGYRIPIDPKLEFIIEEISSNKTLFTYGNNKFILYK